MAIRSRPTLIDIITTIFLFIAALAGIFMAREFPDRAAMWPTFVLVALLVSVGVHLINIFRELRRPRQEEQTGNGQQSVG